MEIAMSEIFIPRKIKSPQHHPEDQITPTTSSTTEWPSIHSSHLSIPLISRSSRSLDPICRLKEHSGFKETKQFTYKDESQFVFMDLSTYEETRLNESDMGDKTRWLKEGKECSLLYWKDKVTHTL
ncbi:hypothetical protein Bca4012_012426 [Brassica carinata]